MNWMDLKTPKFEIVSSKKMFLKKEMRQKGESGNDKSKETKSEICQNRITTFFFPSRFISPVFFFKLN